MWDKSTLISRIDIICISDIIHTSSTAASHEVLYMYCCDEIISYLPLQPPSAYQPQQDKLRFYWRRIWRSTAFIAAALLSMAVKLTL